MQAGQLERTQGWEAGDVARGLRDTYLRLDQVRGRLLPAGTGVDAGRPFVSMAGMHSGAPCGSGGSGSSGIPPHASMVPFVC